MKERLTRYVFFFSQGAGISFFALSIANYSKNSVLKEGSMIISGIVCTLISYSVWKRNRLLIDGEPNPEFADSFFVRKPLQARALAMVAGIIAMAIVLRLLK